MIFQSISNKLTRLNTISNDEMNDYVDAFNYHLHHLHHHQQYLVCGGELLLNIFGRVKFKMLAAAEH